MRVCVCAIQNSDKWVHHSWMPCQIERYGSILFLLHLLDLDIFQLVIFITQCRVSMMTQNHLLIYVRDVVVFLAQIASITETAHTFCTQIDTRPGTHTLTK